MIGFTGIKENKGTMWEDNKNFNIESNTKLVSILMSQ